jgi:hypothetical protein
MRFGAREQLAGILLDPRGQARGEQQCGGDEEDGDDHGPVEPL